MKRNKRNERNERNEPNIIKNDLLLKYSHDFPLFAYVTYTQHITIEWAQTGKQSGVKRTRNTQLNK